MKKIFKYIIVAILVFIITVFVGLLLNKKEITISSIFNQTKKMLDGTEVVSDEDFTYNTAGNDSANYKDGDISGTRSEWVRNGDTWTYTFYVDDPNAQWYIWEDSESLMDGYTGDHTEENIGTLFVEEQLEEFTPTSNMSIKVNGDGKTVYTWLDDENAYKVIDNEDGTYTKVTTKLSFTITNTSEDVDDDHTVDVGKLVIKKVVKDSNNNVLSEEEDNTSFTFTVTLTDDSGDSSIIEGTKIFGDTVFKNGVATLILKAGESVTVSNIPVGISYNVTESPASGYESSSDSSRGTITKDQDSIVTYTNVKSDEEDDQKYVDIVVKKVVTGNSESDEEYNFEIELNELKPSTTYQLSNGTSFFTDAQGSANVSIKLSNNNSVTLKDIPVGAKYKVFEYAGDYISSYVITDGNNLGLINNTASENTEKNKSLSTATETADEDEEVTITFTNSKTITQNLKLVKNVTDDNDTNTYMFEIEFSNMQEGSSFNSTAGKVIAGPNGKAELTIYLEGGEEAEFYNVPVGTKYQVEELASSAIASYTIVDINGGNIIVNTSDANEKSKQALSTEVETVNQDEDAVITFINNTVNQEPDSTKVSVGITKNVLKKDGEVFEDCKEIFSFKLEAVDNENSSKIYPMPEKSSVQVVGNGTASFGTITFTEAGVYEYKITEKIGDIEDCEYDNSVYTIEYRVILEEGLLEVYQTVRKNDINEDAVVFTNKITKDDDSGDSTDQDDSKEDKEDKENRNDKKEEKKESIIDVIVPKTGDRIALYIALVIVSGVAIAVIVNKKRK